MSFKIAARTILHLGADLISSDGIAFYELIKNAFDAGSETAKIRLIVRIPPDKYFDILKSLAQSLRDPNKSPEKTINSYKERIADALDVNSPNTQRVLEKVNRAKSLKDLLEVLEDTNYIKITDEGEGMSIQELQDIYLTIGTRSRHSKRKELKDKLTGDEDYIENEIRPILGEKGVGRLSTMRLGTRLNVKTSKAGEKKYNILRIDWNRFSHESDKLVEDINIEPEIGDQKDNSSWSGTIIKISGLKAGWSKEKLEGIAKNEFSKLVDPFSSKYRELIDVKFNAERVHILAFDEIISKLAHAHVKAKLLFNKKGTPHFEGRVDYLRNNERKKIDLDERQLRSILELKSSDVIASLGPFTVEFYWFNRRLIKGIDGLGSQTYLRELIAQWSGGLMVFRDGFRVAPYGGADDDWLDLDRAALSASGYKVNRTQIIGKVDISSLKNSELTDQTSREGLRNCPEKEVLVSLLQHLMIKEFRTFIDSVDTQKRAIQRTSFKDLEERVEAHQKEIRNNLDLLIDKYQISRNAPVIKSIEKELDTLVKTMNQAEELAESIEENKNKYVHLAGLGLMIEILAHELNRSTKNAITTLKKSENEKLSPNAEKLFKTLFEQLKTLQKRLRILDPLSTRGRQVKESFDMVSWIKDIVDSHEDQFKRHEIQCNVNVKPQRESALKVYAVKGMIVQLIENLISNSVYWLKQEKDSNKVFRPRIDITINKNEAKILFSDNGPGIPESKKEEVFTPYYSTKPIKRGAGLGLFISREIAEYNDSKIYLSDEINKDRGTLNTFVLEMKELVK